MIETYGTAGMEWFDKRHDHFWSTGYTFLFEIDRHKMTDQERRIYDQSTERLYCPVSESMLLPLTRQEAEDQGLIEAEPLPQFWSSEPVKPSRWWWLATPFTIVYGTVYMFALLAILYTVVLLLF